MWRKNSRFYVNIEMYHDVRKQLMRRGCLQAVVNTSDGMEPDSTERVDDVATNEANEEWAFVKEKQVVEQATEESPIWCT